MSISNPFQITNNNIKHQLYVTAPLKIHHKAQHPPSSLNYWYTPQSSITTTAIYNQPYHDSKEPKDNPYYEDTVVSPIPSISSASSRPLSPLSIIDEEDDSWRNDFLNLVSSLTRSAEGLESLSVDILKIEGRMRELASLEKSLMEQYERKEEMYLARLEECERVSQRQFDLINHLSDFDSSSSFEQSQQETNQVMHLEDKLYLLRCEIGLFLGGSVGSGHVVHSFEGPRDGLEYIIAGSGTIVEHQSATISHLSFHKHEYMLHITRHDRQKKFKLLPYKFWTPDNESDQCQFQTCSTHFTFFNRRHHCRRCGILVCQRHSLNRLPLFTKDRLNQWYRVCDSCFRDMIIVQNPTIDSATHLSNMC